MKDAGGEKKEDGRKGSDVETDQWKLTYQQKRAVQRSWAVLSRDIPGRARRIFLEIFRRNPELEKFFAFANLTGQEVVHVRMRRRRIVA